MICFDHVYIAYPRSREVIHDVSAKIDYGERVALLGLNGSGKSSLLHAIVGLIYPSSGHIRVNDIPVCRKSVGIIRQMVGLLFQNADDMLFMPTIGEDVAFGPTNMKLPKTEIECRVVSALSAVGLLDFRERPAFTLSGGQRCAAAFASLLSMSPDVLLLDEPSANLDAYARRNLINILKSCSQTILIATHDLDLAEELCHRAIYLKDGRVIADADTHSIIKILHRFD